MIPYLLPGRSQGPKHSDTTSPRIPPQQLPGPSRAPDSAPGYTGRDLKYPNLLSFKELEISSVSLGRGAPSVWLDLDPCRIARARMDTARVSKCLPRVRLRPNHNPDGSKIKKRISPDKTHEPFKFEGHLRQVSVGNVAPGPLCPSASPELSTTTSASHRGGAITDEHSPHSDPEVNKWDSPPNHSPPICPESY